MHAQRLNFLNMYINKEKLRTKQRTTGRVHIIRKWILNI